MSVFAEFLTRPRAPKPRYNIDPVAFVLAMIGGPLMFTLASFWLLLIPVGALIFGTLPYLVLGTPVLLIYLSRHPAKPWQLAILALLTLFCLSIGLSVGAMINRNNTTVDIALITLIFGSLFAPSWAACTGLIYNKLCRDLYAHPIPV